MKIPTKGMRFYHSRVLDEENNAQLFEVTKVAQGVAYYRAVDKEQLVGSPLCCEIEHFSRYAGRIVS